MPSWVLQIWEGQPLGRRKEWEANLKTAILRRPQHMPSQVTALADVRVMRTEQTKSQSMRKTAKRAEQQCHAHKHGDK